MSLATQSRMSNAAANDGFAAALRPMSRIEYKVWRISEKVSTPLDIGNLTPEQFLSNSGHHGCKFSALEIDTVTGRKTLRFYTVTKGSWTGAFDGNGHKIWRTNVTEQVRVAVNDYDPVGAWAWSPGADVVGNSAPDFIDVEPTQ